MVHSVATRPQAISFANAVPTAGIETVDFIRISYPYVNGSTKSTIVAVTESVSVAICPIPSTSVAGTPCYPCAVGEPQGQQTLFVYIVSQQLLIERCMDANGQQTSVLDAPSDPTPIFSYHFCRGCRASLVTVPVPGYTPRADSRNFDSCLLSSIDSIEPTSHASLGPSSRPAGTTRSAKASAKFTSSGRASGKTNSPHVFHHSNGVSAETLLSSIEPETTAMHGLTTTAYVTATIVNLVEVISICPINGATTTIIEQPATCETYTTCFTIPASLCETFVSTKDNGELTTCTTPVETWTQILTTVVTSTVQADTASDATLIQTVLPASLNPVRTVTAGAASQPQATKKDGGQGVNSASSSHVQTSYVTAEAGRFVVSIFAVSISIFAFAVA